MSTVNRRDELLDQVVDHLQERGLAGLSLRPLAEALGVSTYSLTYNFGSKEQLLEAAVLRLEQRQRATLGARLSALSADRPSQAILAVWDQLTAHPAEDWLVLEFSVQREHALSPTLRAQLSRGWIDWITELLTAAGMPRAKALLEGTLLNALLAGLQVDLHNTGDRRRTRAAVEAWAEACDSRWRPEHA